MTERRQVWLIVGACLVVYAAVMFGFSAAIREPVKWLVAGADNLFGPFWSGVVILGVPLLAGAWAYWAGRDYVPPPRPQLPRWLRYIRNAYLSVLGVGLVVAVAVMVAMG